MSPSTCETCGYPLPADARFCPHCGSPVSVPTTQERRLVTVVFADLAASTELASRIDPERFREVIGRFYNMVSAEFESLRGTVEKFVGDAVMGVFGLPLAHEDDALRAVRAALIIRDRTVRLGDELGLSVPVRVRVGVNSGPVATGSGPADQFLVTGAAVNLTSRLQEAAEPGEVLVGETTWQLTRDAVAYGERRMIRPRGLTAQISAWPVLSLSTRSSRRTIPLVGRHSELALLNNTFARVREGKRPHLVTVVGEPGIGKSRLVEELLAGLPDNVKVLSGRAGEFEEEITFAPLAEMIRREVGVGRETPPAEVRRRLEELVSECCDVTQVQRVTADLGLAVGLGSEEDGKGDGQTASASPGAPKRRHQFQGSGEAEGRDGHRYRSAEIRSGVMQLLQGMTHEGPVVMVFEDMHRAQEDVLDLIEQLLRDAGRMQLLVLCVARDEFLRARRGWGGGISDSLILHLDPLPPEDSMELAEATGEGLDKETAEHVAQHAGGNPFFIIETTGMLLYEHPEHAEGILHGHVLPPTVHAVVSARMDHLPEDGRDLARKASIFGRSTFSTSELGLVADVNEDVLHALDEAEVLIPDKERPNVWRFRHDVLRDVAYESLPKRERMRLHVQAAEGIAAWGEDRYPQAVAYHLEQAALASRDLNPRDRSLPDRAMEALRRAADLARWRMESRTAIDLYERALALAGAKDEWGEREATMFSFIGEARYWLGEYRTAQAFLERAIRIGGADLGIRAHASRFLADIALNIDGDVERAAPLFDQALKDARGIDNPWITARTLLMAAWVPYWRRDLEATRAMFEEALEVARKNPDGDQWAVARALTSLTSVLSPVATETECLPLAEEALALGREMDDPFTIAVAQEAVGNSLRRTMRLEEAAASLDESVRIFRELGARWELASALGDRGRVHWLSLRFEQAEKDLRGALDICVELGERSLVGWTAGQLMLVLVSGGKLIEADEVTERINALEIVESASIEELLLAEAAMALVRDEEERGRDLALQALALARDPGWRNDRSAVVWWIGALFGPDVVGGNEVLNDARQTLESARWLHALEEPQLVKMALQAAV